MNEKQIEIYKNLRSIKCNSILIDMRKFIKNVINENEIIKNENKINNKININKKNSFLNEISLDLQKISNEYQNLIHILTNSYSKIYNIKFEYDKNIFYEISECFENILSKSLYKTIMKKIFSSTKNLNNLLNKFNSFISPEILGIINNINLFELNEKIENFKNIDNYKNINIKLNILTNLNKFLIEKYSNENIINLIIFSIIFGEIKNIKENLIFINLFKYKMNIDVFQNFTLILFNEAINIIENFEDNINLFNINNEIFSNFCKEYEKKKICNNLKIEDNSENIIINNENNVINSDNNNNNNKENNNNLLISLLNKILLFRNNNNNNNKNDFNINKDENNNILTLPIVNIYEKYFHDNNNFYNMNFSDIEHLYSDFKIIIKLIQSYKQ